MRRIDGAGGAGVGGGGGGGDGGGGGCTKLRRVMEISRLALSVYR